ncbi:MAG: hypothetical protein AB7O66_21755 [Limisphaerales bacterium]
MNPEQFELLLGSRAHVAADAAAAELGVSPATLRVWRHFARKELRKAFRREVADMVAPEEVEEECRYLLGLLFADPEGLGGFS